MACWASHGFLCLRGIFELYQHHRAPLSLCGLLQVCRAAFRCGDVLECRWSTYASLRLSTCSRSAFRLQHRPVVMFLTVIIPVDAILKSFFQVSLSHHGVNSLGR